MSPQSGTSTHSKITVGAGGVLSVPERVQLAFIEGDGVGPDVWRASKLVFEAAVEKSYGGSRSVEWVELLAGEKARSMTGSWLPEETTNGLRDYAVSIKGPLATPVGGGIRSLNVTLRQVLDLYACVRPVRYYRGVPSPSRFAEKVNMTIFRENTEDVYAGIEFEANSVESKKLIALLAELNPNLIRPESAIGIKPVSEFGSKRLIEMAIRHAIERGFPDVTLVHKGNIMKFTEGAFQQWGYELAKSKFGAETISEKDLAGAVANGKIVIKDRIADNMFQQVQTRPDEYSVIATTNLNGDYLSDALAAQVGGLGLAPGGNIGDGVALFEATHGTAPKYAGQDKVNPGSMILSGKMMFEHIGWDEVAQCIDRALETTIGKGIVTYDLARAMENAKEVSCSGFGEAIVASM